MLGATTRSLRFTSAVLTALIGMTACRSGSFAGLPAPGSPQAAIPRLPRADTPVSPDASILKQLKRRVVIGSTVDPTNGAQNPYGLTVAPLTAGKFTKGDLVVCDFNAKSNVQGTGEAIVALHPIPKSKPTHVSSIKQLQGCDALALDVDDTVWGSTMVANDNPVIA